MGDADDFHVLTKKGNAEAEIDQTLRELGSPDHAGLHRYFFVSRANQTVVMAASGDSPIARALRSRSGWLEPGEDR